MGLIGLTTKCFDDVWKMPKKLPLKLNHGEIMEQFPFNILLYQMVLFYMLDFFSIKINNYYKVIDEKNFIRHRQIPTAK